MSGKTWKERSAKAQVADVDLPSNIPPQTGLTFNVWYNKWSQGKSGQERFVSPYRLEPQIHSGLTAGDKSGNAFFCLYFAKGMCCLGKKCQYKHHVPGSDDMVQLSLKSDILDCFGREKFSDYRDDMGGVGSFNSRNKTLYVGDLNGALNNDIIKPSQIESRIRFMFGRLGEIDRMRFVENKNCAFVTFRYQVNAEFAKEVMSNQSLLTPSDKAWDDRKSGSGLLVKWAHDDPDPVAKRRREEEERGEALQIMNTLLKGAGQSKKQKKEVEVPVTEPESVCLVEGYSSSSDED